METCEDGLYRQVETVDKVRHLLGLVVNVTASV